MKAVERGNPHRFGIPVVAVAVLLLMVLAAGAEARRWLPLETLASAGGFHSLELAVNLRGDAVANWAVGFPSPGSVGIGQRAAGGRWRVMTLATGGGSGRVWTSDVGLDAGGRRVAVWKLGAVLMAATGTRDGRWSSPRPLASAPSIGGHDLAVGAAGHVVVAWSQGDAVWAIRGTTGGQWSRPIALADRGLMADRRPVAAVDARGGAVVAWGQRNELVDGGYHVAAATAEPNRPWNPTEVVSGAPAPDLEPLAVSAGRPGLPLLAWVRRGDASQGTVWVAERAANRAWQEPQLLANITRDFGMMVDIASNAKGDAVATWTGSSGVEAARRRADGTWRTTAMDASGGWSPDVAVDSQGDAIVVWETSSGHGSTIRSREGGADGSWRAPLTLSAFALGSILAQVGLDNEGNAVAAWRSHPDALLTESIRVAGYDGAPPRLLAFASPANGVAGSPVRFGASFMDAWAGLAGAPRWAFGDGATASGAAVSHVFRQAGVFRPRVTQADALGSVRSATRPISISAPVATISRARLTASFRRSRARSSRLALAGSLAGSTPGRLAISLRGPLRPKGRVGRLRVASVVVPAGRWARALTLPRNQRARLLPGSYAVEVSGAAGGAAIPRVRHLVALRRPPEGAVLSATISTSRRGPNYLTVHRARQLWATFRFIGGGPKRGLRAVWTHGRRTVGSYPMRPPTPFSYYSAPRRLPNGIWRCTLKFRRKTVASVAIRIGAPTKRHAGRRGK